MTSKVKYIHYWIINAFIFLLLFLIQYNGSFSIRISRANPMLPLAAVLTISMFAGELPSALFALICGIVTDGAASTPICFHAILFMIISLLVSLAVHYIFNNNIRSCIAVGIAGSIIYYVTRWIFAFSFSSLENGMRYITVYLIPSVIYTTVTVVIMYYLQRHISKKLC